MVNSFETNWDLRDYDDVNSWTIALSLCPSFSLLAQWIRGLHLVSSNVAFLNAPPNNGDDEDKDTGTAAPPEKGKQHKAEPTAPTKDVMSASLLRDQGLVLNMPAVLYSPPHSPSGVRGQSEQSEQSLSSLKTVRVQSKYQLFVYFAWT